MINYGSDEDEVFIGRDLAHAKSYGEAVATVIDEEVKRIIDECYQKAKAIIMEHEGVLHSCSQLLLVKEKIGQEEFEKLFAGGNGVKCDECTICTKTICKICEVCAHLF